MTLRWRVGGWRKRAGRFVHVEPPKTQSATVSISIGYLAAEDSTCRQRKVGSVRQTNRRRFFVRFAAGGFLTTA